MPSVADREKSLETALAQIDRQFGKGSVSAWVRNERAPVAVIPTGSIRTGMSRSGIRRPPARPRHRDLRPGILG